MNLEPLRNFSTEPLHRAAPIRGEPVFVLGDPAFYPRFGFFQTANPACPFDEGNAHFMALDFSHSGERFTIG